MLAVASETRERSGAAWCGFGRRDAVGGRRDALGGSGVSLALLACSQPRIAQECAVACPSRARVRHGACGLMLCFPHERGALGGRCLLSNRIAAGRALLTL